MKNLQTFEEFLNEATKNDNVITFRKFKDIDHTRLVKWMFTEFGNKYNPGMKWIDGHLIKGGDFELDVTNWEKRDLAVLKAYLKSQSYIAEGLVNETQLTENFNIKGSLNMKQLQDRSVEIKFEKFGIGYSWTDKFGKEKYEEGSFADAKSFDEILKQISEEILYQEENKK